MPYAPRGIGGRPNDSSPSPIAAGGGIGPGTLYGDDFTMPGEPGIPGGPGGGAAGPTGDPEKPGPRGIIPGIAPRPRSGRGAPNVAAIPAGWRTAPAFGCVGGDGAAIVGL